MDSPGRHGAPRPMAQIDEFHVVERAYCSDPQFVSLGLANIRAVVPGIEDNKDKIERACRIFKEHGVDVAVFPEFCLSGYFWDDEPACRRYLEDAVTQRHLDWIDDRLRPLLDDEFRGIVLNNITEGPGDKYYNTTFIVTNQLDNPLDEEFTYHKVFLPGIEKVYTQTGRDDRLDLLGANARIGFTTCYDYLFGELLREYAVIDHVEVIVQVASWRGKAWRDYPGMNVRTDLYYGRLWDIAMASGSAMNQVWTVACNAVGRHGISGATFWGGSGIWAPSGMPLAQASHHAEELLIVHNLDVEGALKTEQDDFDYAIDFREIYRPMEGSRTFTRALD